MKSLFDKIQEVSAVKSDLPASDQQFVDVIAKVVNDAASSGQVTRMAEGQIIRLDGLHQRHVQHVLEA
jgi:hypothetical protein